MHRRLLAGDVLGQCEAGGLILGADAHPGVEKPEWRQQSTHNLGNFAAVPSARYVRVGWGTDLAETARLLPDRRVKAGLDVGRAARLPTAELRRDVLSILGFLKSVEHVSVLLINAAEDTPDGNVRFVPRAILDYTRENGIAVRDSPSCALGRIAP